MFIMVQVQLASLQKWSICYLLEIDDFDQYHDFVFAPGSAYGTEFSAILCQVITGFCYARISHLDSVYVFTTVVDFFTTEMNTHTIHIDTPIATSTDSH